MSDQDDPLLLTGEVEFMEAQIAISIMRLGLAGILMGLVLHFLDRPQLPTGNPVVLNLRLGLWLLLTELLFATYHIRYTAPHWYSSVKKTVFILSEVWN